VDAVRIMSIHKAKGLEFPIVVLAGSQSGTDGRQTSEEALFDWATGLAGLRVGPIADLAGVYIAEKARVRAEEEQKRVFYVAMTRAREHLIVSCAPTERRSSGSFLSMLDDSLGEDIESVESTKTVRVGNGIVQIQAISQSLAPPGRGPSKLKNGKEPSWQFFIDTWTGRRERHESVLKKPLFVTPTLLKREEEWTEATRYSLHGRVRRSLALVVGNLTHRCLQQWDFGAASESYRTQVADFVERSLPDEMRRDRKKILCELEEIFGAFIQSKIYAELAAARILGREVPLLMPWDGQIMEGIIDLIYEHDGLLYLADYKTDTIGREALSEAATLYHHQAHIYCEAIRQSLRREVARFKLIFLRLGEIVEIVPEKNKELMLF
jgi:ATP-dependent helicase/nuclease subunit A